jgi:hypothetical protein
MTSDLLNNKWSQFPFTEKKIRISTFFFMLEMSRIEVEITDPTESLIRSCVVGSRNPQDKSSRDCLDFSEAFLTWLNPTIRLNTNLERH